MKHYAFYCVPPYLPRYLLHCEQGVFIEKGPFFHEAKGPRKGRAGSARVPEKDPRGGSGLPGDLPGGGGEGPGRCPRGIWLVFLFLFSERGPFPAKKRPVFDENAFTVLEDSELQCSKGYDHKAKI